ncbi:MAG: hypothetical protein AABZ67_07355 [Pseudomonadota bacterium]
MSLLIHATITVSGDKSLLDACDARIRLLLAEQPPDGECSDHHGEDALCYDFKVKGGIPFPAFAQASQEFPVLVIAAEWVNVDAGTRGAATIVDGKLTEHKTDALDMQGRSARPVHIAVAGNGKLELALTFIRVERDEWLGYVLTAERDALLRVMRAADGSVELWTTEGSAEWGMCWRGGSADGGFDFELVDAPQAIAENVYGEMEQLAQNFVAEWIWFAAGRREEIAIEAERFARYGYVVADANVRSARLHKMRQQMTQPQSGLEPGGLEFSTVGADEAWVVALVARCWAAYRPCA